MTDRSDSVTMLRRGDAVRASVWLRAPQPHTRVRFRVVERLAGKAVARVTRGVVLRNKDWVRLSARLRAAADNSSLDLSIVVRDQTPGRRVVVDDVRVRKSSDGIKSGGSSVASTGDCRLDAILVPSCGVLWGMYTTQASPQEGWAAPFRDVESAMGRRFDVVKRYHDWSNSGGNGRFPDQYEQDLGKTGERILYFSWVSNTWSRGTVARWRDIAAGKYDESVIKPQAQRLKAWGKPVFIDFDHEMDGVTRSGNGTPAEYVAAYRHIVDVMEAAGVTNVVWAWVPTGYLGNAEKIRASYPGDRYVDWLGYDPYNFYTCHNSGWETPYQSMAGYYHWLEANGFDDKPIMLGEYGTAHPTSDPGRASEWYQQMPAALSKLPRIKAAVQWDSGKSGVCDFRISKQPTALSGYSRAATDPSVEVE